MTDEEKTQEVIHALDGVTPELMAEARAVFWDYLSDEDSYAAEHEGT